MVGQKRICASITHIEVMEIMDDDEDGCKARLKCSSAKETGDIWLTLDEIADWPLAVASMIEAGHGDRLTGRASSSGLPRSAPASPAGDPGSAPAHPSSSSSS